LISLFSYLAVPEASYVILSNSYSSSETCFSSFSTLASIPVLELTMLL
jgi:hypothetical protein